MPIRPEDDKGVLRTDGSVDQTQAYTSAEKIYDPADQPQQVPKNTGTNKKGGAGGGPVSGDQQSHQQETSEREDPSQAAHDADPRDI